MYIKKFLIFSLDSGTAECWYYSSVQQFLTLLKSMDCEDLEQHLHATLMEMKAEIIRQMRITEELTRRAMVGYEKAWLFEFSG